MYMLRGVLGFFLINVNIFIFIVVIILVKYLCLFKGEKWFIGEERMKESKKVYFIKVYGFLFVNIF